MSVTEDNGWEDVQGAAAGMFYVWKHSSEMEWAKEAWGHLHAAGLTGGDTILKVTAAKIRLVTLARIYQEFYGLAWEDPLEISLIDLAEKLGIDPVALGILVPLGNNARFDDADNNYDLQEAALNLITDSQRAEIFKCLKAAYGGDVQLYTRMWHAHPRDDVVEDDEDYREGDEFEVNQPNSEALFYVMKGFREG